LRLVVAVLARPNSTEICDIANAPLAGNAITNP